MSIGLAIAPSHLARGASEEPCVLQLLVQSLANAASPLHTTATQIWVSPTCRNLRSLAVYVDRSAIDVIGQS
jgi:hypothetical protein